LKKRGGPQSSSASATGGEDGESRIGHSSRMGEKTGRVAGRGQGRQVGKLYGRRIVATSSLRRGNSRGREMIGLLTPRPEPGQSTDGRRPKKPEERTEGERRRRRVGFHSQKPQGREKKIVQGEKEGKEEAG